MDEFLRRLRQSPQNVRFDDLDRMLRQHGFERRQGGGSHVVYRRADGKRLTVVKPHGGAKTVNRAAVREVLDLLTADAEREDSDGSHIP